MCLAYYGGMAKAWQEFRLGWVIGGYWQAGREHIPYSIFYFPHLNQLIKP